mmetsp:Transcript_10521/g.38718  ORF Transcript_10521/g.38718 Transcript_10521/m.38718 type:complete len:120 (-) Transcript_10521:382-741(-)
MNRPDQFERFVLPDGVRKVTYEKDTKVVNAAKVKIEREDHTLGNLLRMQLHRDNRVLFAGYMVPHPLEHHFVLRVQTIPNTSPFEVIKAAVDDLQKELTILEQQFTDKVDQEKRNRGLV